MKINMKKTAISVAMAALLVANPLNALAAETMVPDFGETTNTIPSTFYIEEKIYGMGATVSVPADMTLTYDSQMNAYFKEDSVSASGLVKDYAEVIITSPRDVVYTNENGVNTMTGKMKMGKVEANKCYVRYSGSDLLRGYNNFNEAAKTNLILSVPASTAQSAGDYESTVEFGIKFTLKGQYFDVADPFSFSSRWYSSKTEDISYYFGFQDSSFYQTLYVNLSGFGETGASSDIQGDTMMFMVDPRSKLGTIFKDTTTICYQLDENAYYEAYYDGSTYESINSWLYGIDSVEIMVVPAGITTKQLKCRYTDGIGIEETHYESTAYGDALAFVKGVDETGYVEYVPNIVYRGTQDEWRALSGGTDWVFANSMTPVYVHCEDGIITYCE